MAKIKFLANAKREEKAKAKEKKIISKLFRINFFFVRFVYATLVDAVMRNIDALFDTPKFKCCT